MYAGAMNASAITGTRLFGREAEERWIVESIERIQTQGQALLIRGAPGVGKSSLLAAASAHAQQRGLRTLKAAGVESEANLPFAGLHQLLQPLLGALDTLPAPQRSAMEAAFGVADAPRPGLFLIGLATLNLLTEAASRTPLMILLDDVQFLDRPTSDVLTFVARRLQSDPVVLLASEREGYQSPFGQADLSTLELGPLDEAASDALLSASNPGLESEIRQQVLEQATGNPLALVELPKARLKAPGSSTDWLPLTSRLEDAFASRLLDLPQVTRTLMLVAAADDKGDFSEILSAAANLEASPVTTADFTPATSAGLVELIDEEIRFRHPLVRSATYQTASVENRRAAHAALAGVIANDRERRVWHRAASLNEPDERVATDLEQSAERAALRGGIAVAIASLERAAGLTLELGRKGTRLLRAAELAYELGRGPKALSLLQDTELLDNTPLERARGMRLRNLIVARALDKPTRTAYVDAAQVAYRAEDSDLALNLLWLVSLRDFWRDPGDDERIALAAMAERIGGLGDPRVVAILAYTATLERTGEVINRLRALLPRPDLNAETTLILGGAANAVGALDVSSQFLARSIAQFRSEGRLGQLPRVFIVQARNAMRLHDWRSALPLAEEAAKLASETGQAVTFAAAQSVMALIAGLKGDLKEANEREAQAHKARIPMGRVVMESSAEMERGLVALCNEDYPQAYAHLRNVFDVASDSYHPVMRIWCLADFAEACVRTGCAEEARQQYGGLACLADSPALWVRANIKYAQALLSNDEDAERCYEAALNECEPLPLLRARLLLNYGIWLRRRRRVGDSRVPLRNAREAFDRLGLATLSERSRLELRASGETSAVRTHDLRDELTPQELQIAQLAARGMSNREIGALLYLSAKTVASHLYRVFPKLGVTSRGQLRDALD
jgi:DNA-binding CsgD family transcriptional regulator